VTPITSPDSRPNGMFLTTARILARESAERSR
jgi:hypothetical protein